LIALGEGEPTRVLTHGAKKHGPAPVWSALVFPFLTSSYGNGGAKFSKRFGSYRKFEWVGCAVRALAISKGVQSIPVAAYCHRGESLIFQEGNRLGERIVSWGINHESAFVPQLRDYGVTGEYE
jgi:hypothetical protein